MNDDELELLKRRLTDDVRETVQKQLFRTYAMIGAAVIAVLGYAGWNIFSDARAKVEAEAADAVAGAVAKAQERIDSLKVDVATQTGKIEYERERAAKVHGQVADQLSKLNLEAANLSSLNESVAALADARRQLEKDLADIKAQTDQLAVLREELLRISERLKVTDQANATAYGDVINTLERAERDAQKLAARPTVYLQFAGGARDRAQELAARLSADDFIMPGEERHAGAVGKREVRYFYEEDLAGARALADATLNALVGMGYRGEPPVKLTDLTGYRGQKPKQSILELWVEL